MFRIGLYSRLRIFGAGSDRKRRSNMQASLTGMYTQTCQRRLFPRLEESLEDCGYLFCTFRDHLQISGHAGIVAIHFSQARFLPDTVSKSVALFIRIMGKKLKGRIEGGYKAGADEFFLLLVPDGFYSEALFRQDIETIRRELGSYCTLPHMARRIAPGSGTGKVMPQTEGVFITNQQGESGTSTLFRAFQALMDASSAPVVLKRAGRLEMEQIIANQQITPVFQPIFSLKDGEVYGYEALSRITRPDAIATTEELFANAAEYGLASPLEMLCRKKALTRARELDINGRIFLNVCPDVLQASEHERGITAALLDELQIERSRITFELTERTLIEDYELFQRVLSHYREQGYSIAIDDLGSGYAGLNMLARLEPDYVKLARFLIASIDTSTTKQALVEALVTFCGRIGASVIAEGIERSEELEYLISAGVSFGQGYLLAKPSPLPFPGGPLPCYSQNILPFTT